MGKIYERHFKESADTAIDIDAGNYRCVKVPFPYECMLGKVVVKQYPAGEDGGTSVPFAIDIFNSEIVPEGEDTAAYDSEADLYRVCSRKTALAGATIAEFATEIGGGHGYLSRNMDGTQTIPERYIYVVIRPTGAGDATKWMMAIGAVSEIG